VIDGALCQFTPLGERNGWHAPLATAVVEFCRRPLRVYVREHPYGLLPGIPNLYCLDGALRLQWMAEWPDAEGPCTRILEDDVRTLTVEAASGARVRLDANTGRLLAVAPTLAAAG
jgi:hypothetical protein